VKILITTDFYLPCITGVTTVVVNEQAMLEKLGHDVRILTIGPKGMSFFEDGVYHMAASRLKLFPDSYMTFRYQNPLVADILSWKPDLVHSNNEFFSMGYARRIADALHIPLLHTCHTDFTRYDEEQRIRHTLWDSLMAAIVRRRVRYCDLLISPSSAHKAMLVRYHIKKPVVVLPSGIDLARFKQPMQGKERERLRANLGFTKEQFLLLSVCRLAPEKRVGQIIDAFFLLSFLESSARLLIVGGGPKEESLRKRVRELGLEARVVFTGPVPPERVHRYYQLADIFVSASVRESQGLGFVEAMASSLPLLLREDASLGLSIEGLGIGYLYQDAKQFVQLLSFLMENPIAVGQMGMRSRKESKRFSLSVWAQQLSAICLSLQAQSMPDLADQQDDRRHDDQG
jgi:1,2-diacylglycerol 3-alpha-glucosyltransferase